jgi:cobalt-zinc-cadmium efflux system outer membrane protein
MRGHTRQKMNFLTADFIWKAFIVLAMVLAVVLAMSAPSSAQTPPQYLPARGSVSLPLLLSARSVQRESGSGEAAPAAQSFTLDQLLQIARTNNPTLAQAQAGIREAAGRTLQAGLWPNPTVGYAGDEMRGGSYGGGEQGVFVQQEIILGGKLGLNRKIFAEEGKQAATEAEEQRLRVENSVRIAFYQSLAAQQMVEIRTKLSALAKDAVETTQQLFNVGQADQPDLLQAQVEADEADLAVISAQQNQQQAWRVLSANIGRPAMPLSPLAGDLEALPSIDADHAVQTILRDSPAVKIAQLGVMRADAALTRARRETIPDLSLRAGMSNDFEPLGFASPPAVGLIGFAEIGVNLRIFDRNQGNIQAAKADLERANLEVQRVSLALRQMAAPVLENYASSRAVAETYKARTLPNAQRAYELYLQKYRQGAAAYPQVLIAQRTLFELQSSYISALENVWTNAITLQGLLLTGGLEAPAAPGNIDRATPAINTPLLPAAGTRP